MRTTDKADIVIALTMSHILVDHSREVARVHGHAFSELELGCVKQANASTVRVRAVGRLQASPEVSTITEMDACLPDAAAPEQNQLTSLKPDLVFHATTCMGSA